MWLGFIFSHIAYSQRANCCSLRSNEKKPSLSILQMPFLSSEEFIFSFYAGSFLKKFCFFRLPPTPPSHCATFVFSAWKIVLIV